MVNPAPRGRNANLKESSVNKLILTAAIAAAIVTPSIVLAQTADAGPMLCHTAKQSDQATFDLEFGLPMILGGGTQSDR